MSILSNKTRPTLVRAGVTVTLAAAAIGGFAGGAQAANPSMTLSASTGSSAGLNTLTLSIPSTATTKFSSGNVGVLFFGTTAAGASAANCPGTTASSNSVTADIATTVTAASAGTLFSGGIRYLSTTKVSATVPDLRATPNATPGAGPTTWLVCAYNKAAGSVVSVVSAGSGSAGAGTLTASAGSPATLIGKAVYTVAAAPTFTTVYTNSHAAGTPIDVSGISPSSGPAIGGQTITVTGSNFQTNAGTLTATLGGAPLTSIVVLSNTQFTAVTPARPASATPATLTITTNGGTSTTTGALVDHDNAGGTAAVANTFVYKNGITVSPNTVPKSSSVDVDVQGVGFSTLTFDSAATAGTSSPKVASGHVGTNDDNAHVYLVAGTYTVGTLNGTTSKTVGQESECINPVVISDTELVCTIATTDSITDAGDGGYTYAAGTPLTEGTYTVTVVSSGEDASPSYQSVMSSGATFTVSDF